MRFSKILALLPALSLTGCPQQVGPDASDASDAAVDVAPEAGTCTDISTIHSIHPGPLYVRAGGMAQVSLRLRRDRGPGCATEFTLSSANPAILTVPPSVRIEEQRGSGLFTVTGGTPGRTRLRAVQTNTNDPIADMSIDVIVLAPNVPECPVATAPATGRLAAGTAVTGAAGSPLAAASVSVPAAATTTTPMDVTIRCAADQIPTGYEAIGPAVAFGPAVPRFPREVPINIPINAALVPAMYELQTEIAYTGPGAVTPRIVAMANTRFTTDGRSLTFFAPKLGTYQAVIRRNLGGRTVRRHYTYRAILGISMGALGSSMIGTRHPELFDYILPLGGPADWAWFGDYFRRWHLGGFCTAAERATMGAACDMASNARTPEPDDYWVVDQNFEHFNYPDGRQGQGGTFDRQSYVQIYRDLAHMFGNPAMPTLADGITPLGLPAGEINRTDAERCATPVTLNNFYDDEYNPDGSLPVISFCDGRNVGGMAGLFQPGQGDFPFEISVAVDVNRNGIRDPGEPVIRNLSEPWDDFGTDHTASRMEAGYDAMTNPDPAGDDYDRQYNPGGTEGNFLRETAEEYRDVGVDGIVCPTPGGCPYDVGESNGRWDTAPGIQSFFTHNPRDLYAHLPAAEADRLGVWADGGTRDLFNFGAVANHFVGAVSQQGADLHIYNNFSSLITGRAAAYDNDTGFVFTDVDYAHLPRHSMMRYGFEDASSAALIMGDGGHVGTVEQITGRLFNSLWWMQAHWPNGNREIRQSSASRDDAGRCAAGYSCTFEFMSKSANRSGPVSIYLPPGYHRAENARETYPVVYFLHGYGQEPMDLIASGILVSNYMSSGLIAEWQRPSKYIMVFPDGRCRPGDRCLRGTFYTDSPNAGHAQMEQYFLDLYRYVNTNYRASPAQDVDVTE